MELRIGKVVKSHGVKGEVAIEVLAEDEDVYFAVGEVLHGRQTGKERDLTVKSVRPHQQRLLVTFEEIPDRTAADSLRGMQFFAPPLERDEDSDEYYDHELIGLKVRMDGDEIGEVTGVMDTPNRKILEVAHDGREVLIPFVLDIVPEVDLEEGYLEITPPHGLLDL
ncbi:ribosome maturation factor RimM [Corynebacterium aquatimens]|uniref:ribosome maturation factor RimM n=1 Tax=Corynebacterium TaxID=1716 RepID=UPI001EECE6EF|nr:MULTISPECIES: ribosome maturation factor RimM [Corynebacterium]QYH19540.1 ribosome maturation factor RimM [Corynebacterium aquatimens]UIZ91507.1 ribosome maturation factor RimM [Corynebacterium sp. CNCTC7651]